MWLFNKFLLIILPIFITACGFQPLYKKQPINSTVSDKLASIKVEHIEGKLGIHLKNILDDILNPGSILAPTKYTLKITKLEKHSEALSIQKDSQITRYNQIITLNYEVIDSATSEILEKDSLRGTSSYNTTSSVYATFVSEEDASKNNLRETAEELKKRLIALFLK